MNLYDDSTKVYAKLYHSNAKIDVSRGGTRSSKTRSEVKLLIKWLVSGYYGKHHYLPNGKASIVRKYLPALKATVLQDVYEVIDKYGLDKYIHHHKTDKVFSFNGRTIDYFSADDQQKVRGRKRDILFCNEANELTYKKEFRQLLLRTSKKIVLDFNPDDPDIWLNTELEMKRATEVGDVKTIVSTYKDNQYLDKEIVREIELMEKDDPEAWQVFGLGGYGRITGLIFPNVTVIPEFPWRKCDYVVYGVDWGYINPMCLVRVGVDDYHRKVYAQELYYKREKNPYDLIDKMPALGVLPNDLVYCDSNRPLYVNEMEKAGFRGAQPAIKGAGSVEAGIMKLKGYELCITADSTNLLQERRKYKWAVNRNGEYIEGTPVKANDHGLDGIRYAVFSHNFQPDMMPTRGVSN